MARGYLEQIHPILPVRDVITSLLFYTEKLGFDLAFADYKKQPTYAGIRRDNIEIHLQWYSEESWKEISASSIRLLVQNIEGLYDTYASKEIFYHNTVLKKTLWNTREFAFYDPDNNALTFYMNL